MSSKKLLLIAPVFEPLHNQIIESLNKMGYDVTHIPDIVQQFSPYPCKTPFKTIKKAIYRIYNLNLRYHRKFQDIYDQSWDILLCIDGWSIEPKIIEQIKFNNPKIKTYYYLWDSTKFYNFSKNFHIFDHVYTFDYHDAKIHNIEYLPLFWKPMKSVSHEIKYDVSFIGKFHGDRFEFFKKIRKICEETKLDYFFRIILTRKITRRDRIYRLFGISTFGKIDINDPIVSKKYMSEKEVTEIIQSSRCIIDSGINIQHGLTNRLIISLSQNKKLLTTNKYLLQDPLFFNNLNVRIIDREKPILDKKFIESEFEYQEKFEKIFKLLEIDNWLKIILNGESINDIF